MTIPGHFLFGEEAGDRRKGPMEIDSAPEPALLSMIEEVLSEPEHEPSIDLQEIEDQERMAVSRQQMKRAAPDFVQRLDLHASPDNGDPRLRFLVEEALGRGIRDTQDFFSWLIELRNVSSRHGGSVGLDSLVAYLKQLSALKESGFVSTHPTRPASY